MASATGLGRGERPVAEGSAQGFGPLLRQLRDDAGLTQEFTSTEVVYGVTGTDVTELPECGVSP